MEEKLQSSRFQLVRKLGSGGMGLVYEAYDHQTDSVVALKTIADADGEALYRLKQEFRSLTDVQHPNLVRLGELMCEGGQWFFTMELVAGRDFHSWVRLDSGRGADDPSTQPTEAVGLPRAPVVEDLSREAYVRREPRGFDEARLRSAARQLAAALCAIHGSGRVHRDIKPTNVLVRDDGHLMLFDFGLIEEFAAEKIEPGRRGLIMGTPSFMAPEQADSEHVGPAADWYAFGVTLYLGLTGKLPFRGSPDQTLEAKRRWTARAPHELVVDVPEDLDQLCQELLERDPQRRPDGAERAGATRRRPRRRAAVAPDAAGRPGGRLRRSRRRARRALGRLCPLPGRPERLRRRAR